jgi:hypothetical protein
MAFVVSLIWGVFRLPWGWPVVFGVLIGAQAFKYGHPAPVVMLGAGVMSELVAWWMGTGLRRAWAAFRGR